MAERLMDWVLVIGWSVMALSGVAASLGWLPAAPGWLFAIASVNSALLFWQWRQFRRERETETAALERVIREARK